MGAVVAFNYKTWTARYPEFASVNEPLAQQYFNEATVYHANDGTGRVNNATRQLIMLNMMTAHIAALYAVVDGKAPSPLVGKINSATEGSVSVSVAPGGGTPDAYREWLMQTKYGASYVSAATFARMPVYRPPTGRRVSTSGARIW